MRANNKGASIRQKSSFLSVLSLYLAGCRDRGLNWLLGFRLLVLAAFIIQSFALMAQSVAAETLSVPFSRGFIGSVGTSTGKYNNIVKFSTLGVARAYFIKVSDNDQFGGTQGNDYRGPVATSLRWALRTIW